MEATFDTARRLKQIVDGVKPIVADVNLYCDADGLSFQAMDASHVSLCSVRLCAEAMSSYVCARPVVLGLPLGNLSKLLSAVGPDDRLTLSATGTDVLRVHAVASSGEARFELNLMDIDSERLAVPLVSCDSRAVTMPSVSFKKTIADVAMFGDVCRIAIGPSGACFSGTGDFGSGTIRHRASEAVVVSASDEAALSFGTRYLELFARCGVVASAVRLVMQDGQPLRVVWSAPFGSVEFCLAPQNEP